jgi:ABC-type amino acid transport substrate-binding protein
MQRVWAVTAVLIVAWWLPNARAGSSDGAGLVVKVQTDAAPYQYFDAEGEAAGADVAWFRAAARMAGMDDVVRFVPSTDSAIPSVLAGCALGASNRGGLEYCLPHREIQLGLFKGRESLVRGVADLRSKAVAVVENSPSAEYLSGHGFGRGVTQVGTARAAMDLLSRGEIEAVVMEKQRGLYALEEMATDDVVLLREPVHRLEYGFGVVKGQSSLRTSLETGMAVVQRTGQYDRIAKEYLAADRGEAPLGASTMAKLYSYGVWVMIPVLLMLVFGCFSLLGRRKSVEVRILELEAESKSLRDGEEARRAEQARQRFVINRMSTVSLVDQLLSVSRSKDEEQPQELGA